MVEAIYFYLGDNYATALFLFCLCHPSHWRNFQSRVWKLNEPRELVFNFEMIDHLVQQIVAEETDWSRYFYACGIQPFSVVYEELVGAYEETVHAVLSYLQIPVPEKLFLAKPYMIRPTDSLSEEWAQRYQRLKGEQQVSTIVAPGTLTGGKR